MKIDKDKFTWTENQIQNFKNQIEYFKSFKLGPISNKTFFEAYKACYLLVDKIPLASTKIDVTYLLRARANYNDEIFENESDISYNTKNTDRIKLGRSNRPEESMFYASVPDEIGNGHFRLAAAMECSKEFFEDNSCQLNQYVTFGTWYLKEEFEVVNLCNQINCLKGNQFLNKSTQHHEKEIYLSFPDKSATLIVDFWKFLSEIASNKFENDGDHFITTAFISAIMMYWRTEMGIDIHGILYPSTMTESNGLNIVLTPKAVEKFLSLKTVYMARFTKEKYDSENIDFIQCTEEGQVINKSFTFTRKSVF